jgi:hypothetical protein
MLKIKNEEHLPFLCLNAEKIEVQTFDAFDFKKSAQN